MPTSYLFDITLMGEFADRRRESLDFVPFWNAHDLRHKLNEFMEYYNCERVYQALGGDPPDAGTETTSHRFAWLDN